MVLSDLIHLINHMSSSQTWQHKFDGARNTTIKRVVNKLIWGPHAYTAAFEAAMTSGGK